MLSEEQSTRWLVTSETWKTLGWMTDTLSLLSQRTLARLVLLIQLPTDVHRHVTKILGKSCVLLMRMLLDASQGHNVCNVKKTTKVNGVQAPLFAHRHLARTGNWSVQEVSMHLAAKTLILV